MPRRLGFLSLLVVALFAVAAAGVELRHRSLARALIAEVARLTADRPRPVHREPALDGGSFEHCLGPLLDRTLDAGVLSASQPPQVRQQLSLVRNGDAGMDSMDGPVREAVQALEPWARQVSACTRQPVVGDERGLGPFAPSNELRSRGLTTAALNAGKVLQLEAWGLAPASALEDCADGLALGRDLALDQGLVGAMVASALARPWLPVCARALEAADEGERTRFVAELGRIRAGYPSFASVLELERAQMQLMVFHEFLWDDELAQLSVGARAFARSAHEDFHSSASVGDTTLRWLLWSGYVARIDAMIAASRAPQRDRLLASLSAHPPLAEQLLEGSGSAPDWVRFVHRHEVFLRVLELLESAARVKSAGAPLPSVTSREEGGRLVLTSFDPDSETLSISVSGLGR